MKEIGGYFGLEQTKGQKEFYDNLISLNTARNSLVYIVKSKKITKVYIPYFLCDSIFNVLDREHISYDFYHISYDFFPVFDKILNDNEYIYIVNYYGLISNKKIIWLKEKYKNIIVDNTHSFFQKPILNIDTIYSCRKFFGVPDGSYLSTNSILEETLEIDNSDNRLKHIYGRIKDGASAHYNEFKDNDKSFKNLKLCLMSKTTHSMLSNIDYDFCQKRRTENFQYLNRNLKKINKLVFDDINGAYAYPFWVENGMEIKKKLAEVKIYVATLWPNVIGLGGVEEEYAKNILPIPCDQRYSLDDMQYIVEVLECFI